MESRDVRFTLKQTLGWGTPDARLVPIADLQTTTSIELPSARRCGRWHQYRADAPANALRGIVDHLLPVRNPARRAGDRVQHGEHLGRETERLQRYRRREVETPPLCSASLVKSVVKE